MGLFTYKPKKNFEKNNGIAMPKNYHLDQILYLKKSCHNWQLAFLVMSCLAFLTIGAYFHLANKTKLVPYIVELDKEKNATFVGRMDQIKYKANDQVIFAMLSEHVINTRSISLDKVFTYKKMKREYSFLGKEMKNKMNIDINNLQLEKKFKENETIDVQITSMLKNGDNIYQINWTEKYYTNGSYNSQKKWTGVFSVIEEKNIPDEDILINPLGLIIQNYHISIDLSI